MTLIACGATYFIVSSQHIDSHLIDLAGRQRMLSQKIANGAIRIHAAVDYGDEEAVKKEKRELEETAISFRSTLTLFSEGGVVRDFKGGFLNIGGPPNTVKTRIDSIEGIWKNINGAMALILSGNHDRHSHEYGRVLNEIDSQAERLLDESEKLVLVYREISHSKEDLLRNIQIFSLIAAFLVACIAWLFVRRGLIRPLGRISTAVASIGNGDLDARAVVGSGDEIGTLAGGINAMAKKLSKRDEDLRKLYRAVENSPVTIVITDDKGTIEYVNPRFSEITGYCAEEVIGKNPSILKSGKTPPEVYEKMWAAITSGQKWEGELLNRKKSGELYWDLASITPIRDKNKVITHYMAIKEDVTKKKEKDLELQRNYDTQNVLNRLLKISLEDMKIEDYLKVTLDVILSVPWLTFQSKGSIFLVENDPDKLVMKAQKGLSGPVRRTCATVSFGDCICGRAAAGKEIEFADHIDERHEHSYEGIMPHGHYCVPVKYAGSVIGLINVYTEDGHKRNRSEEDFLLAIANTLSGVIERKRTERELERGKKDLEQINIGLTDTMKDLEKALEELKLTQSQLMQNEKMAGVGQLAAGVAHEINNPIGFIRSNLGTLEEYFDDLTGLLKKYEEGFNGMGGYGEEVSALGKEVSTLKKEMDYDFLIDDIGNVISETREGTERVSKIVQDLKEFSHVDRSEDKSSADINEMIESTLNVVWHELKYKAEIKKNYGDIPKVSCYPHQLNQVFMNLLVNSAQAMEKKGVIGISTYLAEDKVFIEISDTGSGMPQDVMDKIFEPFYTTKAVGKGTGLGLSVSYGIIESHGGRMSVASRVGEGTTFTIELPVGQPA